MKWLMNPHRTQQVLPDFDLKAAEQVRTFHRTLPDYSVTPLRSLPAMASRLGLLSLHVKDEDSRFGLHAFKGLGGTYCVARCLADRLGWNLLPEYEEIRQAGPFSLTFATATDGNHGRGIAYASKLFGCGCHVYMPKGSALERVENIRRLGAEVVVTDAGYDETVRMASHDACLHGWQLVQDTAWPGYTEIPGIIMQGYLTLGDEIRDQAEERFTHIFLQAGVGSMAASLCCYFRALYGEDVRICVVEAEEADCLLETARADDGELHATTGSMQTMMAGLCCGYPCLTAWEMLKTHADAFVAIPDETAARGMAMLARPFAGDPVIASGESGASTYGLVLDLMTRFPELRDVLGMNASSRVLCLSTEGITDRANYERVLASQARASEGAEEMR